MLESLFGKKKKKKNQMDINVEIGRWYKETNNNIVPQPFRVDPLVCFLAVLLFFICILGFILSVHI